MSSPASEGGGHARPPGPHTPARPDPEVPYPDPEVGYPGTEAPHPGSEVPHPGTEASPGPEPAPAGPATSVAPAGPATSVAPAGSATSAAPAGPEPGPARQAPRRSAGKPGRRSSAGSRRAKRSRVAAAGIVAVGVLVIGLATGFGSEPSAEPTAETFLLDWQQQQYEAAGTMTTAPPSTVAAFLAAAFAQVNAAQLVLSMDSVVQHGGTAQASFTASVNLSQQGRVWKYHGRFGLRRVGGGWKVEWAPSVVNPDLGPGERLAVVTEFPARAPVLDDDGKPLQVSAPVYVVGVWPERLANPAATARGFANLTHLVAGQVLGQIRAAPPQQFLRLASLDPATYASMRSGLRAIPGLVVQRVPERLFQSEASSLVGRVGNEVSPALRADGAYYAPGTTVGLSGLEQAYQRDLLGTPTTEVVSVDSAGAQTGILARWPGTAGTPVRTTISSKVQDAALAALESVPSSGEIVAVQASTGKVLAVAQHQGLGVLPVGGPLNAKLVPGTAFTIVSAAALLESGLTVKTPISCDNSFTVGGQTFTSYGTGELKPFSADFASGCGTAFAGLSERLNAGQFARVVKEFGIGADWSGLPVPAFSGSVPSATDEADLAAETIGQGNVRMSLLSMAMVAATVKTGNWHTPRVMQDGADPAGTPLNPSTMSALRGLMRGAVRSGAARAASLPHSQVYGQVGMVHTSSGWMSWFVGYRGDIACAVIETGKTQQLSAAALAGAFLSGLGQLLLFVT